MTHDPTPDFWGFLQQQEDRLRGDFSQVASEQQLEIVRRKWLDPVNGILERLKSDPYFALAKPSAKTIFQDNMRDRIELETRYCREVWNLYSE